MKVKRRITMRNKEKDFDMNKLEIVHKPQENKIVEKLSKKLL